MQARWYLVMPDHVMHSRREGRQLEEGPHAAERLDAADRREVGAGDAVVIARKTPSPNHSPSWTDVVRSRA
jgi:hypothetical protein